MRRLKASLPWIAAIGGILAAIGGFWAAIATSVGSSAALDQVNLERKPVLVLTCSWEFLGKDRADRIEPPRQVAFMREDSVEMVEVDPNVPTYTHDGLLYQHPPLFNRCTITNGGRLPLVAISVPVTFYFYDKARTPSGVDSKKYTTHPFTVTIPVLSPGQSYVFAVANASWKNARPVFSRSATVTRIDTEKTVNVTVFVDSGVVAAENLIEDAYALKPPHGPPR